MKDLRQRLTLQFVTSLGLRSRTPNARLSGVIIGVAGMNVLLGSWDGEASQVVAGLGVVAVGLMVRSNFLIKRRAKFYENDPHSGQNET
jgi:hypothetical protein